MGPESLNIVQEVPGADHGTWGKYQLATLSGSPHGLQFGSGHISIFPNRTVPAPNPSSRNIGWASGTDDAWLIEFQVYLPPDTVVVIRWNSDADYLFSLGEPHDNYEDVTLSTVDGTLVSRYSNQHSSGAGAATSAEDVLANRWIHVAAQKNAGSHTFRVYQDGLLVSSQTPSPDPPDNLDVFTLATNGPLALVREFVVRSVAPYPTIPYTPGVVSFASAIGNTQSRWNSYML